MFYLFRLRTALSLNQSLHRSWYTEEY